jgi:O-acetylhomoserine (thiol)-lyase
MSADTSAAHGLGTLAVHAGQEKDPTTGSRAVPIYATSSYVFADTDHAANLFALKEFGNIYSRLMNPTNDVLEKRLAALDGGAAGLAFASGQAAITAAILTICHAGQNFISATSLYGGTWTLFTQRCRNLHRGPLLRPAPPRGLPRRPPPTRRVYYESLGNPKNDVPDFRALADAAHAVAADPRQHGHDPDAPAADRPRTDIVGIRRPSSSADTACIGGSSPTAASSCGPGTRSGGRVLRPDPSYHGMVFERRCDRQHAASCTSAPRVARIGRA